MEVRDPSSSPGFIYPAGSDLRRSVGEPIMVNQWDLAGAGALRPSLSVDSDEPAARYVKRSATKAT